jgi:uncharacterized membrane protein
MSIFPTKILLATDGSTEAELAARTAVDLSQKTDSELHVIHVLDVAKVGLSMAVLYSEATGPETHQLHSTAGAGAGWGAFWGFLFGLIFFVPFLGAAIGAGTGALSGSLADVGIDDDFIRQVREQVTPGTSALFALTSGATAPDRVVDELKAYDFELISTNLPEEQENQLREAFAQEQ